ncbi:tripartite-type tricarboxylate transporter receptor subunit TctC [Bradyrhizobium sp. cir1]|uniref:tripartite tricarboxylate transporter substrate binding protein n=1 Tax=Bradyrhizobium sp. cir1 TaxID=1445730 RepID=UPI0016066315|nr:tripartite tricarboxylate transporter substrate binding protein [Bradyrhizobium sp. cir1]MBB4371071.1 tripartite-type tricarboxylate transporter receptor subunit TctC [Bradyrhizobium sp. cir1]
MISRRGLLGGALLAGVCAETGPVFGQPTGWPSKVIRLIVPFSAGGPSDAHARYVAAGIAEVLGGSVIVENVGGAAGTIGMMQVARAAPDGYTIGLGHVGTQAVNPHVQKNIPYDPFKAFVPVAQLTEYNSVLLINPNLPYKTLADLLAAAKAKPETITYGSAGLGSTNHLATEQLARAAGVKFVHVPYKGYAPARTDLLAGNIDFMFDVWGSSAADFIKSGTLRALASTAPTLDKSPENIPLISEMFPGFKATGWTGIFAPAGTPPQIVARLSDAIARTLNKPDARSTFESSGYQVAYASGDELGETMRKDYAELGALIKTLDVDSN